MVMKKIIILLVAVFVSRIVYNFFYTTIPIIGKFYYNLSNFSTGETLLYLFSLFGTVLSMIMFYKRILLLSTLLIPASIIFLELRFPIMFYLSSILSGFSFGIIINYMLTLTSFYGRAYLYLYSFVLGISTIFQPILQTILLFFHFTFNSLDILMLFIAIFLPISSLIIDFPNETKSFKVKFNKGSMLAMIVTTVYVLPYSIISTYLPVFMAEKGISLSYSYSIFIPFFIFMTLTRFILSYYRSLGERIDSLFSVSVLLTIIGSLLEIHLISLEVVYISLILLSVPHGILYPLASVLVSKYSNEEERNQAMGLYLIYRELSSAFVISLFSLINISQMLLTTIILSVVSYVVYLLKK